MGISGNRKAVSEGNYSKKTGVFEASVEMVNPTRDELNTLLGTEIDKEIEYTGKDKDGNDKATVSIWLKEKETGELFNLRFYVANRKRESVATPGNIQWINEVGQTTWGKDGSSLPEWFSKRAYREALFGEEELHDFLRNWINLDYSDPATSLLLDTKKLFNGNTKELKDCIKNFTDCTVCALATIRVVTGDDGDAEYQGVYNRKFLPGSYIKHFKGAAGKNVPKAVERFVATVTDTKYGCTDYYKMGPLSEYDPSKNIVASNKAVDTSSTEDDGSLY